MSADIEFRLPKRLFVGLFNFASVSPSIRSSKFCIKWFLTNAPVSITTNFIALPKFQTQAPESGQGQ